MNLYFVLGYNPEGVVIFMNHNGFANIETARHYLSTIHPSWQPFIVNRVE